MRAVDRLDLARGLPAVEQLHEPPEGDRRFRLDLRAQDGGPVQDLVGEDAGLARRQPGKFQLRPDVGPEERLRLDAGRRHRDDAVPQLERALQHGLVEHLLAGEVIVDVRLGDAGGARDHGRRRPVQPVLREHVFGPGQDLVPDQARVIGGLDLGGPLAAVGGLAGRYGTAIAHCQGHRCWSRARGDYFLCSRSTPLRKLPASAMWPHDDWSQHEARPDSARQAPPRCLRKLGVAALFLV